MTPRDALLSSSLPDPAGLEKDGYSKLDVSIERKKLLLQLDRGPLTATNVAYSASLRLRIERNYAHIISHWPKLEKV